MGTRTRGIFFCLLFNYSGVGLSADLVNIILLPEPFKCHQPGLEIKITEKSVVGALGRLQCHSRRPTYGAANKNVSNNFSRLLVPWRYAWKGAFRDGAFAQALIGVEKNVFRSEAGSKAEVTFLDLGLHYGYQWFWRSGFNISVLAGLAVLVKMDSDKSLVQEEKASVRRFLNKNTRTNLHVGAGILFGWKF